jgi:hypothetical protein
MQQFAAQEGLTNVRFLSAVPSPGHLQNKEICLLGAADASWQALISHIKVRRILGRASFLLRFCWQESPWKQFYGFDFSAYAPHDLEMYHENRPLADGMVLSDITDQAASSRQGQYKEEIIYTGAIGDPHAPLNLPDGTYNCVKVSFDCGTVVLPLQESLCVDSQKGKQLQKVELTISVINAADCRFSLLLSGPGWTLRQFSEQPLASMGHIVRKS